MHRIRNRARRSLIAAGLAGALAVSGLSGTSFAAGDATSKSITFIAGAYFILVGLSRFVEEHFRGEPQTMSIGGLRLYQWLALMFVIGGAALTTIAGASAPRPALPGWSVLLPLAVLALVTYAAYGVDMPRSNRRFSRLL